MYFYVDYPTQVAPDIMIRAQVLFFLFAYIYTSMEVCIYIYLRIHTQVMQAMHIYTIVLRTFDALTHTMVGRRGFIQSKKR